jgi:hypothetical protein
MRLSILLFTCLITTVGSPVFGQVSNGNIHFELQFEEFWSNADGDDIFAGQDEPTMYVQVYTSSLGWDYDFCKAWSCDVPCTSSSDLYYWQTFSPYTETIDLFVQAWESDNSEQCTWYSNDDLYEEGYASLDNTQVTQQVKTLTWASTFGAGNSAWVFDANLDNYDMKLKGIWGYTNGNNYITALNFGTIAPNSSKFHVNANRSTITGLHLPAPETIGYSNFDGNQGADVIYKFTLNQSANVTISTDDGVTNYDSYLRLYDINQDQIDFNDDLPTCSGCASEINRNLCAGTYYVLVEGYNGDEGDFKLTVSTSTVGSISTNWGAIDTECLNNSGSAGVSATGGVPPYTYNWSNGATGSDISGLGEGTYTATITDACGNTATQSVTIENTDQSAPQMYCQNFAIEVSSGQPVEVFPSDIDNGSSDYCGIDYFTLSQTIFTTSDAGTNTVTLTGYDVLGNSASCSATVTVNVNTATTTIDGLDEWKVFPNPNNGIFQLNLEVYNLNANSYLTITDLFGRQVLQQPARNGNQRFDLSQAAPGVYLLQLHHNGSVQTERILVQ